jgi:hypothetical protein
MGTKTVEMIDNGKGNKIYPALHTVWDEENEC